MGSARMTFDGDEFAGLAKAEAFATECGLSIGRMQRDEPMGLMFGDFDIQKWRNLRPAERAALHGQITGSKRTGPVHVTLFDTAPEAAWARWRSATETLGRDVAA